MELGYGQWQGGYSHGHINRHGDRLRVVMKYGKIDSVFRIRDFPSYDAAMAAALAKRDELSLALGRTGNRYRTVTETVTGEQWYEIDVGQGKTMYFDPIDLPVVRAHKWYGYKRVPGHASWYVMTSLKMATGKRVTRHFHAMATGFDFVDHVDSDGLNNRRSNLRQSNPIDNARRRCVSIASKTGVTGVTIEGTSYLANWKTTAGVREYARFNIKTMGRDTAFQAAVAMRRAKEVEHGLESRTRLKRPHGSTDIETELPPRKRRRKEIQMTK